MRSSSVDFGIDLVRRPNRLRLTGVDLLPFTHTPPTFATFSQLRKRDKHRYYKMTWATGSPGSVVFLANPITFTVVCLLAECKQMSTGAIAKAIGCSLLRTSTILTASRLATARIVEPARSA